MPLKRCGAWYGQCIVKRAGLKSLKSGNWESWSRTWCGPLKVTPFSLTALMYTELLGGIPCLHQSSFIVGVDFAVEVHTSDSWKESRISLARSAVRLGTTADQLGGWTRLRSISAPVDETSAPIRKATTTISTAMSKRSTRLTHEPIAAAARSPVHDPTSRV